MADEAWLSDNEGRINNLSLAPNAKNTLFPLFEAVMNAIQAIEERFGRDNLADGYIEIEALKDERGDYVGFSVTDNGIGFNNDNILSFRKFDSRRKIKIGGKGVGRLLWLKVSDKATVSSHFYSEGAWRNVSFDFTVDSPVSGFIERLPVDDRFRTEIVISPFKSEYATKIPKKLDTIANRLIAHFVSYFTNISHPKLVLRDIDSEIDLFDAFAEKVERDGDSSISEWVSIPTTTVIRSRSLSSNVRNATITPLLTTQSLKFEIMLTNSGKLGKRSNSMALRFAILAARRHSCAILWQTSPRV